MTNFIDERVTQARQKIGSEMMLLMYYFIVIAFCVKSLYFGMELSQCMTEFIIMIAAPIYQNIRSRQLGVVLGDYKKATKASNAIFIAVGIGVLLLYMTQDTGGVTMVKALSTIVSFAVVFSLARFCFAHMEEKRAKKLEEEYNED